MRARDLYVHAEVTGAASVVVKNPTAGDVPPRTLAEAGQAAVAYSVSTSFKPHRALAAACLGAKSLTCVSGCTRPRSKSAPTGEYLTTGSFIVRADAKNSCYADHLQSIILVPHEPSDKEDEKQDSSKLGAIKEEPQPPAEGTENKEVQETEQREIEKEKENEIEKKEEDSDDDSDSSEEDALDTHIKVDHGTGQVFVRSTSRTISEMSDRSEDKMPSFPSLPKKGGKKQPQKQQQKTKEDKQEKKEGMKRGQRSKLKKIKEKYKDQDDEDRAIMMELLQSAKGEKESKKAQKKAAAAKANKVKVPKGSKIPQPAPLLLEADSDPEDLENEPDLEQTGPDADSELLNQLTGVPHEDDELLFAVPVVAPYSALVNYKYKVKLTPGTGKRGKAAKTAVQVFLRDKAGTAREKDLLKAVKEENIARNFPGKPFFWVLLKEVSTSLFNETEIVSAFSARRPQYEFALPSTSLKHKRFRRSD
ncbi:hypothetical protein SFRURICE_013072, partial [Spodoptera frugiperda]